MSLNYRLVKALECVYTCPNFAVVDTRIIYKIQYRIKTEYLANADLGRVPPLISVARHKARGELSRAQWVIEF